MARIVLPAQQGHDEENGGKKVCDEGNRAGRIADGGLAIGLKNCSRTMRAALTRKMRKAWALRLRKMGKCATPACLL